MRGADKAQLRTTILAARRARSVADIERARTAIRAAVLSRCTEAGWQCVAAYEPLRTEPGSRDLLARLHGTGVRVLVPNLLANADLDWAQWHPDPERPRLVLGVDAIARADAILVPALAVAHDGSRLGRGGGSYDRALARARQVPIAALLYEDEFLDTVPSELWDQPVTAVVVPSGWRDLAKSAS